MYLGSMNVQKYGDKIFSQDSRNWRSTWGQRNQNSSRDYTRMRIPDSKSDYDRLKY